MTAKITASHPLTKDSLYQLIAMNPAPIGRAVLLRVFGQDEKMQRRIDRCLSVLTGRGLIEKNATNGYSAVDPWADIAYAVVGEALPRRRVPIQLLNMPTESAPVVTMTRAEFIRQRLKAGDRIVVGLVRLNDESAGLRARFIGHAPVNNNYRIAGIFNNGAQAFTPLDRSIKTRFRLAQIPDADKVPRQFLVDLPPGFDIRNPVISMTEDQKKDADTGASIGWIIARKHEIAHAHPADVLKEARTLGRKRISYQDRHDLRDLAFCTVDPPDCTDHDDAFVVVPEDFGYSLYVAISDVPEIVRYGTAVDREAYKRGITYYLSNHTCHMLPPSLSTNKCSLIPDADRPAMIVRQKLGWDCRLIDYDVFAAVIRSREKLTYGQFYDRIERGDPQFTDIAHIHDVQRRMGMMDDMSILLRDSPDMFGSKSIIERLMVQTNSLASKFLTNAGIPFLSRNFELADENNPAEQSAIRRAYYAPNSVGHAHLRMFFYTHMSSPIRRYPDILAIRGMHQALGTKGLGLHPEEIEKLPEAARHMNARREVGRAADHDEQKYHVIRELERLKKAPIRISVNEIGADYVDVTMVQYGLRQRLSVADLSDQPWRIENGRLGFADSQGKVVCWYKRGDTLLGQITSVDQKNAHWKMSLVPSEADLRRLMPAPRVA